MYRFNASVNLSFIIKAGVDVGVNAGVSSSVNVSVKVRARIIVIDGVAVLLINNIGFNGTFSFNVIINANINTSISFI